MTTRTRIERANSSTDRKARRIAAFATVLGVAGVGSATAAQAGGPTTFSNAASITIPQFGAANPRPSTLTVSDMRGAVTDVTVTLHRQYRQRPRERAVQPHLRGARNVHRDRHRGERRRAWARS